MRVLATVLAGSLATAAPSDDLDGRQVFLQTRLGQEIEIATLSGSAQAYSVTLNDAVFSDHFLSMRPFRCVEGEEKTWCYVPYPYEIRRDVTQDLTDLEYDFLFVWKGRNDYGINMWNGVYYVLTPDQDGFVGAMHEMDMDMLAVPPAAGELRPISEHHLEEADPDSHWLPKLIIR